MIFAKVEIKDINLIPSGCTPIIEQQLYIAGNQLKDHYPNFTLLHAFYEIRVETFNAQILQQIREFVFYRKAKGIYLRFDTDFVLTPEISKLLAETDIHFIFDFNFATIRHTFNLPKADYYVLRTSGYFTQRKLFLEQGEVFQVIPGGDSCIEEIDKIKKILVKLKVPLILQFSTSALKFTDDNTPVSVRREEAVRYKQGFCDNSAEITRKLIYFIDIHDYLIENLAFDFHCLHPESIYQLLHSWPSLPVPFPLSILSPQKQSKLRPKIDDKTTSQEDSYKTTLGENGEIFVMDL